MSSDTFQKLQKATSGQAQSLSQRMRSSLSAEMKQRKTNRSMPVLPPVSPARAPHNAFDIYSGTGASKSVHNRLAGLNDPQNTTGLFADTTHPPHPLPLCVRCGNSPSLCMKCSELECENTLTFYRKTRAAGAATLFTKAFVEAGYSKLIKFVVFRLLKNSCQARSRVRMKKKAVVEKLFGTNLVYLPFNAWKRYTRENVLARKDKSIEERGDQVKVLETQNQKLSMQLRSAHHEIDELKGEIRSQGQAIHELTSHVEKLQAELARERERVKSLSALAVPFQAVCSTLNRAIEHQMEDTGYELNTRAHVASSYNFADILDQQTIRTVKDFHETAATAAVASTTRKPNPTQTAKTVSNRAFFAVSRCLSRWINAISSTAGTRMEAVSGKSLDEFLPPHEDIEDITDLRNGKILSRVILALIVDRQVLEREKTNVFASQSTCSLSTAAYLEQYSYGTWAPTKLTFDEVDVLRTKGDHAMELLDHILRLATRCLDVKSFQPAEVFSGYRDWLWHLVMSLMNASIPTVTSQDYALIDDCIQSYYQLMQALSEREPLREHLTNLHRIVNDVYTVEVPWTNDGGDEGDGGGDPSSARRRHDTTTSDESPPPASHGKVDISRILSLASQSEDDVYDDDAHDTDSLLGSPWQRGRKSHSSPHRGGGNGPVKPSHQGGERTPPPPTLVVNTGATTEAEALGPLTDRDGGGMPTTADDASIGARLHASELHQQPQPQQERGGEPEEEDVSPGEMTRIDTSAHLSRRELHIDLEWTKQQYECLGKIVDDMVLRRDHVAMIEYAARLIDSHHQLSRLRAQVVQRRRKREDGVRLTTDIRQFLYTQLLRITDPHSVQEESNKR